MSEAVEDVVMRENPTGISPAEAGKLVTVLPIASTPVIVPAVPTQSARQTPSGRSVAAAVTLMAALAGANASSLFLLKMLGSVAIALGSLSYPSPDANTMSQSRPL